MCARQFFFLPFPSNNYLLCSDLKSPQTPLMRSSAYYRAMSLIELNGAECGFLQSGCHWAACEFLGERLPPLSFPFLSSCVTHTGGLNRRCEFRKELSITRLRARRDLRRHLILPPCFNPSTCFKKETQNYLLIVFFR